MKPQCRKCKYLCVNDNSDELYCGYPAAEEKPIYFSYRQQRRPEWCPLMTLTVEEKCDIAFRYGAGCSDCDNYDECEKRLIDFLSGKEV